MNEPTIGQRFLLQHLLDWYARDSLPHAAEIVGYDSEVLKSSFQGVSLNIPQEDPTANGFIYGDESKGFRIVINESLTCFTHASGELFTSTPPIVLHKGAKVENLPVQIRGTLDYLVEKARMLLVAFYDRRIHELMPIPIHEYKDGQKAAARQLGLSGAHFVIAHELGHLVVKLVKPARLEPVRFAQHLAGDMVSEFLRLWPKYPRQKQVLKWAHEDFASSWTTEFAADIIALRIVSKDSFFGDQDYWGGELNLIACDLAEQFHQKIRNQPYPLSTHPFGWMRTQVLRSWLLRNEVFPGEILVLPMLCEHQKNNVLKNLGITCFWENPEMEKLIPRNVEHCISNLWKTIRGSSKINFKTYF